jgi:hypothetical protein
LKLEYDVPLSNLGFKFNLRRYIMGDEDEEEVSNDPEQQLIAPCSCIGKAVQVVPWLTPA